MKSGTGYEYTYDDDGKVILLGRKIMGEKLGRKLTNYETVSYRDGDKSNCTPENLFLTLRHGTPIDKLVCKECGTRGHFTIES